MRRNTYYNSRKYRRLVRAFSIARISLMLLIVAGFIAIIVTKGTVGLLFTAVFALGSLENVLAGIYSMIDENGRFSVWTFLAAAVFALMAFLSIGFFRSGGWI
ncbi:MAG: hypothetical protein PUE04_02270 [Lachnospira sp.]|nr:hypothetical protein [Lachnospira sp.]